MEGTQLVGGHRYRSKRFKITRRSINRFIRGLAIRYFIEEKHASSPSPFHLDFSSLSNEEVEPSSRKTPKGLPCPKRPLSSGGGREEGAAGCVLSPREMIIQQIHSSMVSPRHAVLSSSVQTHSAQASNADSCSSSTRTPPDPEPSFAALQLDYHVSSPRHVTLTRFPLFPAGRRVPYQFPSETRRFFEQYSDAPSPTPHSTPSFPSTHRSQSADSRTFNPQSFPSFHHQSQPGGYKETRQIDLPNGGYYRQQLTVSEQPYQGGYQSFHEEHHDAAAAFPDQHRGGHAQTPAEDPRGGGELHTSRLGRQLRERSPQSSTALLSLLQRYPSAKQSLGRSLDDRASPLQWPEPESFYRHELHHRRHADSPRFGGYQSALERSVYEPSSLDTSVLDAFFDDEDDMNRSTKEWRSSFAQMQNRFREPSPLASPTSPTYSQTLPRRPLSKSSSNGDVTSMFHSMERRASEAPPGLGSFWEGSLLRQRAASPPPQRILTAAERLQMLHEDTPDRDRDRMGTSVNGRITPTGAPQTPVRRGSGEAVAARRAQYLKDAQSRNQPDFAALDTAVDEMGGKRNGFQPRRAGLLRFPTEDNPLSPPPHFASMGAPSLRSTSPDSEGSAYNVPTGLPHPPPKHNIKEQLYQAGISPLPTRHGLRTAAFPVPQHGSVASRISDFERRPGTPSLPFGWERSPSPAPMAMSPSATVFRTKPVIEVDRGGSAPHTTVTTTRYSRLNGQPALVERTVQHYQSPGLRSSVDTVHSPIQRASKDLSTYEPEEKEPTLAYDEQHNIVISTGGKRLDFGESTSEYNGSRKQQSTPSDDSLALGTRILESIAPSVADHVASVLPQEKQHPLHPSKTLPRPQPQPAQPVQQPQRYTNTLRRKENVPQFHFPFGKPQSGSRQSLLDAALQKIRECGDKASLSEMGDVCAAADLPIYWKRAVFDRASQGSGAVSSDGFRRMWTDMETRAKDDAARLFYLLGGPSCRSLRPRDLWDLVHDVVLSHPALDFVAGAVEFHDKYVDVVTTRIFWRVARTWSGRMGLDEVRRSNLIEKMRLLDTLTDINVEKDYFSYEHFYVIYCKFWELDEDHDMFISEADLARHAEGAFPARVIRRVFRSGCVRAKGAGDMMTLAEFTQLLLADEDKQSAKSVEYWFRVCDEDGDGIISLHEMEQFYKQVVAKLEEHNCDSMQFSDVACNLIDAICPKGQTHFALADLKKSAHAERLFNTLVNWRKFYVQETQEGSQPSLTDDGKEMSQWERYCAEEYEALMQQDEEEEDDEDGEHFDETYDVNLDDEEKHA